MQKKQRREKSSGALKDKCRKTTIFFLMTFFSIAYSSSKIKPTKAKQGTNYGKKTSLLYLYLYTKNFISLSKIPKTNPFLKDISKKKETKKLFFPYPRCSKAFSSLYKTHYQRLHSYIYIYTQKFLSRLVKSPKQTPSSRIYQKRKRRKNFFFHTHAAV